MIIVNYFKEKDSHLTEDGYDLYLEAIVNDVFDIFTDPVLIESAIDNDTGFCLPKGVMCEIHLVRGTIQADPIDEPAFCVERIIEKKYDKEAMCWYTPLVRM